MVRRSFPVFIVLLIVVSLLSNLAVPISKPVAAAATTASAVPPAWKTEWNKTVAAAKQEGKVVIFATVVKNTQTNLTYAFAKEFGFQPEFRVMTATEYMSKLFAERRAGIYSTDLYMGGLTPPYSQLRPAGFLDSLKDALILPEVTDGGKWYGGRLPFIDRDNTVLAFGATAQSYVAVNTERVKLGEIGGYADLLDPKWKGQIVINDPTISGRGLDWFQVMDRLLGPDYMKKLLDQEPVVTRDRRLQVEWLARGKYAAGLALDTSVTQEFIKKGAQIKFVWPREGVQLGAEKGGLALINKAPHPQAAKVFANWLLTREAQGLWSRDEGLQSARTDVQVDFLSPDQARDSNKKYMFMVDEEWFATKQKTIEQAKQVFSRFLK